jgi:hypothetical protein
MPTPRSRLVDVSVTPWYHCISRCVRRAFLCGENHSDRKQWIENRLRELVGIFAIECAGFSVMDNHLHLLLRIDSRKVEGWSGEEVARRWFALFPLRDIDGNAKPITDAKLARFAGNADWIAEMRSRLANLGWFMKSLKEPLARIPSCYLRLVDASSRMIRAGKASLEAEMAPIFQRLGLDQHTLESTVVKLFSPGERVSNRLARAPGRLDAGPYRTDEQARGAPHVTKRPSFDRAAV